MSKHLQFSVTNEIYAALSGTGNRAISTSLRAKQIIEERIRSETVMQKRIRPDTHDKSQRLRWPSEIYKKQNQGRRS